MSSDNDWTTTFRDVYQRGLARYRGGAQEAKGFLSAEDKGFLGGIGCSEQELFDFVEDACDFGEPSYETALLLQAERRDYFRTVQEGKSSGRVRPLESFPAKTEQLGGMEWLPRIMAKARAKLRGELPADLMYG